MIDSPLLFEDYDIDVVPPPSVCFAVPANKRGGMARPAPAAAVAAAGSGGGSSPGNATRKASLQPSMLSVNDTIGSEREMCRICHCEGGPQMPLISPCFCSGSLKFVHQDCLQQWIKSSDTKCCELCKFEFIMNTKLKPFTKWERLDMSALEQRKVLCSVTFHLVAITCVLWSLYVLIERTSEEMRDGQLDWPFWTKLIVVAVGFTGGLVFMYVQLRMYIQLFNRWKAFNRIIFVQNAPSKNKDLPTARDLMPVNIVMPSPIESTMLPSVDGSSSRRASCNQQSHHSNNAHHHSKQVLCNDQSETTHPEEATNGNGRRSLIGANQDDTISCTSPISDDYGIDSVGVEALSNSATLTSTSRHST